MVSVAGIEPTLERPKRSVIPFHHTEKNLLVLLTRIELVFRPYQGRVMPLYYKSLVVIRGNDPLYEAYETPAYPSRLYHLGYLMRIELIRRESQSLMLPLHHRHHIKTHHFLFICHGRHVYGDVFLYGRGVRERSEFYWLKASYFTLKFHPHRFGYLVTVHLDSPLKIW